MMSTLEKWLAIISVVGFIGSLPQIWGQSWKDIWLYHIEGTLPWKDVMKAYKKIVNQLREDNVSPTAIIGVGRGGIISAGLICSELVTAGIVNDEPSATNSKPIPKIRVGVINSNINLRPRTRVKNYTDSNLDYIEFSAPSIMLDENDKVLLVVAQHFTGKSLQDAVIILVEECNVPRENIYTAALFKYNHKNIKSYHTPDYFGINTKISKTVPWKDRKGNTDRY